MKNLRQHFRKFANLFTFETQHFEDDLLKNVQLVHHSTHAFAAGEKYSLKLRHTNQTQTVPHNVRISTLPLVTRSSEKFVKIRLEWRGTAVLRTRLYNFSCFMFHDAIYFYPFINSPKFNKNPRRPPLTLTTSFFSPKHVVWLGVPYTTVYFIATTQSPFKKQLCHIYEVALKTGAACSK